MLKRSLAILSFILFAGTAFAVETIDVLAKNSADPLVLINTAQVETDASGAATLPETPPAPVEDTIITNGTSVSINTTPEEETGSNLVEFNIIDNGTISGAKQDTAMLHVFDETTSWDAFWKKHMTVVPAPAAPPVDFETQQVLAIIDSDQPNSGYYIRLERIETQNGELWVYATREQPGANCMSLGMVAQPYVIVTIGKTNLPAKLLLSTRTYEC